MSVDGPVAALVVLGAALLLWLPPGATRRARVRAFAPTTPPRVEEHPTPRSQGPPGARRRWALAGAAGTAVAVLLGGGLSALLAGAGTAVLAERSLRHPGDPPEDDVGPDLPVACDLLAVCLAAGTPIGAAAAMSTTSPTHDEPAPLAPDPDRPPVHRPSLRRQLARRWAQVQATGEAGMSTAEYAVGTVAACAFAAVLYQVVTGGSVVGALGDLVQSALSTLS